MMLANTIGSWFKRHWVWITAVFLGLVVYVVYMLFPTGKSRPLQILKETEDKVKELKEGKEQELAAIDKERKHNATELAKIKNIPNEKERLTRLAEFANRRKRT